MPKMKLKPRSDGRLRKVVNGHAFYGRTEREIDQKILAFKEKKTKGPKFSEIADQWWSEIYDTLAAQTLRSYIPAYKRTLEEFGNVYIKDITPRDILSIYKRMASNGYTRKTISNQRIIYNQIFDYAVVADVIQYNPCASVKLPKAKKSTVIPPASVEDEQRILNSDNPWIFPLFALLTGLRKQEILALQWKDIDFEQNIISVTKAVEHIGKTPNIKSTKTDSGIRDVPLLLRLKKVLLIIQGAPNSYIFSDDGGKTPLSEHRFERLYKNYSNEVGITCSSRQLRHSYATIAVEEDIQPKDLQKALGHADITTTLNVYAAARKKSIEKVALRLNSRYSC